MALKLKGTTHVKDLGVTVASSLKFSKQCKDAAGKTNRMLSFINRNFFLKAKDIILSLYFRLIRPLIEYVV